MYSEYPNTDSHTNTDTHNTHSRRHTGLCISFIAENVCLYVCAYYQQLSNNNHAKTKINYWLTINHIVDQIVNVDH